MRRALVIPMLWVVMAAQWALAAGADTQTDDGRRPRADASRGLAADRGRVRASSRDADAGGTVTEERLRAHLEVRSAAMRAGDHLGAELALGLIEEARDRLGAPNAIVPAVLLVEEARQARAAGDLALALDRIGQALRLAPDLLGAHALRIALLAEQDYARVARIAHAVLELSRAWCRGFRNQVLLASIGLAVVLLAMALTAASIALALLARHLRYLAHDLSIGLPKVLGGGEVTLLVGVLILLPGALGHGWFASLLLALGVTLAYQTTRERVCSLASVLFLSSGPWLAGQGAPLLAFHGSRVDHLAGVLDDALSEGDEAALRGHLAAEPDDGLTALVLGVRSIRRGDLPSARDLLERAVRALPQDTAALNNLGVVEYRLGGHDAGERLLRSAAGGARAEPHLCLSLIASERGDFDEADAHLRTARRLDPALTARVASSQGESIEARFAVVDVPQARLWRELYGLHPGELAVTRAQLWRLAGGRGPDWALPAWGMLAVAMGLLGFRTRSPSGPCARCAAPAPRGPPQAQCPQCQTVFGGAAYVAAHARAAKEREVRRVQLRRLWVTRIGSVLPGLPGLLGGQTVSGVLLLGATCGLAAAVASRGLVVLHAWHLPGDLAAVPPGAWALPALGALMLASYGRTRRS